MKQFQLQLQEQEQKYQQLAKEHTRLKQENKKLTNSIPQDKGNKLEELLIDLSNELMDNQREYQAVLQRQKQDESKMSARKDKMINSVFKIFQEIGREKTIQFIRQDFKDGKKASQRTE